MDLEPNPHVPPNARLDREAGLVSRRDDPPAMETFPKVTARDLFLTWEKWLRPAYNLILAGVAGMTILSLTSRGYPVPRNGRTVFHFVSRAIAANFLFTVGPIADYYFLRIIGCRSLLVAIVLFSLGTLFSVMIVPISVFWFWSTQYPGIESFH